MRPVGSRSDEWWRQLVVGHGAGATRKRAPEVERTAWGWMLHAPALPAVWALNRAQVVPGAGGLAPDAVIADVVARHRARGLDHVAVDVRADADGARLAPVLVAAGFAVARLEVLCADAQGLLDEHGPAPCAVATEPPEVSVALRHAGSADLAEPERTEVAEQWVRAPAEVEHLTARDEDGAVVGAAVLHPANLHVELDDVLTHPAHRRRGVGRALVLGAAAAAVARDVSCVGLLSEPEGDARRWYTGLGFVPVGTTLTAVRTGG